MPKKKPKRKERKSPPNLEPWKIRYLITGKMPDKETIEKEKIDPVEIWEFQDEKGADQAWQDFGESILSDYIKQHPGKRPWKWWRVDSPRWQRKFGAWFDDTLPDPRLRVGGIGTETYEVLSVKPWFNFGIPLSFIDKWSEDYYNGRAKDKDGNPIKSQCKPGDFKGIGIDFDDPPMFEAEASYLKRHNLLLKSEEKRLKSGDFEPESCIEYIKTYEGSS
jgi:hypothetical protein